MAPKQVAVRGRIVRVLLACMLAGAGGQSEAQGDAEMELVSTRIRESLNSGVATTSSVDQLQSTLRADGTWADIDYASTAQTDWVPRTHLERLRTMAKNFAWGTGRGDAVLKADILRGYDAWILRDPQSTNWWYQAIGTPQTLGEILILMRSEVSPTQLASGLTLLARAYLPRTTNSGTNTGANRTDRAYSGILRGLLTGDAALTDESFLAIGDTILVNSANTFAEGIQADHTFQQHGEQLYNAGYGLVYASGVLEYASWGASTRFGYSDIQKRVIIDHLLDGAQWLVRGNTIEYTANGRGISRSGLNSQAMAYGSMLDNALAICGGYRSAELTSFRNRISASSSAAPTSGLLVGNRNLWRADMMVHHRPGFSISVKTSSTRTRQPESGNGEGLRNLHLGDGVTLIQRTGNEYDSIMPVWDWRRLPGVTAEQGSYSLKPATDWGVFGTSTFAGGLSDGSNGIAVFDYSRLGVAALKSWFFLGDVMVALGTGVSAPAATSPVLTSVNQALLQGSVTQSPAGAATRWVHHDQIGYFFPGNPSGIVASTATQSGSWQAINTSQSATVLNRDVFSLHINHGVAPSGASYSYLVAPGLSTTAMATFPVSNHPVLRNDATVQAVGDLAAGRTAAVFRGAGEVAGIRCDTRGCVMVTRSAGWIDVAVSDPSQTNNTGITVELDDGAGGLIRADTGVTVESLAPRVRLRVTTARSHGRTFQARFYTRPHAYRTVRLTPVADAMVYDGSASRNYGSEASLNVKSVPGSSGFNRESYLRFNLAGLPATAVAATLELWPAVAQTPGIHALHPLPAGAWTETAVTWQNRPFPSGPPVALWLPALSTRVSADATPLLAAANGTLDLCVTGYSPTNDGLVGYGSREATDPALRPVLEVVLPREEIDIWRIEQFGADADRPDIAGDLADPDGDGESNLVEFATAQSPRGGGRWQNAMRRTADGRYLEFVFVRRRNSGINERVLWSGTLAPGTWTTIGVLRDATPMASTATTETLRALVPVGQGRRFVRLEFTRP
jgi:chondroitin AC lyase